MPSFHDFIDPETWQRIQDTFAKATRLEIRVVDAERRKLSTPSRLTRFCQLVEGSLLGRERCFQSDLETILLCGQGRCCVVTPCHARIIGFGVPIIVDGEHIATVTGGECVAEPLPEEFVRQLARELNIDEEELVSAANELEVLPASVVQATGELIGEFLRQWLDAAKQRQQLETKLEQVRALCEVGKTMHTDLDVDRTLESIVDAVMRVLKVTAAFVMLIEANSNLMSIRAARGLSEETTRSARFVVGTGIVGHVAATGESAVVPDMQQDPRVAYRAVDEKENLRSLIAVPLRGAGGVIGVLAACTPEPHRFTEDDLALLTTLAGQAAVAVENARLYQQVAAQVKELSAAYDALQQAQQRLIDSERLAVIGRVASSIAHEVRNPLTAIMAFASTIRDHVVQLAPAQTAQFAETIVDECRRLNKLIDDIRDYAKPKQYHVETQPIRDVIEEVLSFLRLDPTFKRFPIYRRFEADPLARYDRDRMKQVFINLLRNAAEAIDKDDGKIEVAITEAAGQIAISISDNGKGIPPDQRERIFEPFYTTKGEEGTGLGLGIVRQIIISHGGRIAVDSAVGKGTTFTVFLPSVHDAQGRDNGDAPDAAGQSLSRRAE
ncbi:MAG: PocR ligand-binding domain-containing protein [Abditibacteriales bacterium]|nr:PocR ligand-binding domain-containing protein [Abditibacteriales bacterium]MDW8365754.1 PocR ligand-binding domain-containing protein [Abditibacteriales bacterium]